MADDFFKNGDKGYSENLNDGVLVGNAFDWTLSIDLPTDNGGVFPNSSSVSKAKVCDVSITPNSNLSIGSTISNSGSGSQVYRLTVYPNFNRFGGFKSITLTADSGVTFYIANKGGNSPIANNLNYANLGNVPELKVLKEYDIVVTIPAGKSVSGLSMVLQSKSASVSASINPSNVTGLNSALHKINLTADNYNMTIDSDVTLTAKVTDASGNAVSGKQLQLYLNGTSLGADYLKTSDSNGEATFTYTCEDFGIQDFSIGNTHCQVKVDGWKEYFSSTWSTGYIYVMYNESTARLTFQDSSTVSNTTSWADFSATVFSDTWIRPYLPVVALDNTGNMQIRVSNNNTKISHRSNTGSTTSGQLYIQMMWSHHGLPEE